MRTQSNIIRLKKYLFIFKTYEIRNFCLVFFIFFFVKCQKIFVALSLMLGGGGFPILCPYLRVSSRRFLFRKLSIFAHTGKSFLFHPVHVVVPFLPFLSIWIHQVILWYHHSFVRPEVILESSTVLAFYFNWLCSL